jgi:hypothetical protein
VPKLSHADRKLIEQAGEAVVRSLEEDVSAAVESLRSESPTLEKLDPSLIRAYLDRSVTADPEFQNMWDTRGDNRDALETKVKFAGRALGEALDAMHSDESYTDDGVDDPEIKEVVGRMRTGAEAGRIPSSVIETVWLDALKSDRNVAEAWASRHTNPAAWSMAERSITHNLRNIAHALTAATRPSQDELETDDGRKISPIDMMAMSDKEFAKLTKTLARRTERAKAKGGRSK